jgi:hypothetical protein
MKLPKHGESSLLELENGKEEKSESNENEQDSRQVPPF